MTYSAEFGVWGITSPLSASVTFDAGRNVSKDGNSTYNYWLGVKPYFTFYEKDNVTYMFYFAPKVNVNDVKNNLIEFGINPNITLNKNLLFGLTLGNQITNTSQWNMFISGGFVYLLK